MTTKSTSYLLETLDSEDDDGTMVESLGALQQAVVGHRIVSVEDDVTIPGRYYGTTTATVITLDNGTRVSLVGEGDCCAYTDLDSFRLHPERIQHAIAGVGTTEGFTTWHIFADAGDIMEMKVGWSCGNPFYYGYGFTITVEDLPT